MRRLTTRTDFIIWKQRDGRYILFSLRYGSRNYIIDIVLVVRERVVLDKDLRHLMRRRKHWVHQEKVMRGIILLNNLK